MRRCISSKLPVLRRKVLMPHCRRPPRKKNGGRVVDDPDFNQKTTNCSRELGGLGGVFLDRYLISPRKLLKMNRF